MSDTDPNEVVAGTVPDVKEQIAKIDDADTLAQVRDAEADGKDRAGVHAAIDAKEAELTPDAGDDKDPMETATRAPGDLTDEQIDTIAGTDKSHETANEDAKLTLERNRDTANDESGDVPTDTIFHGQGGGFGL